MQKKRVRVVSLGEVLWDEFETGARLGGAPANFALHAAAQGADAALVSRVGDDARGCEALALLQSGGVNVRDVQSDPWHPTGRVVVQLHEGKPQYEIVEGVAWDALVWRPELEESAAQADLVCFGTLAQRSAVSCETIQRYLAACPAASLRLLDVNFRQHYHDADVVRESLRLCSALKLSDEEVPQLRHYVGGEEDETGFLLRVSSEFELRFVLLSRGEEGCSVFADSGRIDVPGQPVEVVNTVGAGDAFASAFALNYFRGNDLRTCAERANRLGAYVATRDGATPDIPEALRWER